MNLKEWTKQERGRQAALASFLGVTAPIVCQWASGQKSPSIKTAVAIEQFTDGAVSRKDLRPNDWHRIWPDLADQQATAKA